MIYQIYVTAAAEKDLANAFYYIDYVLKNPLAADALLNEFEDKVNALALYPQKFPVVDDEILADWKIGYTVVKNYLAFYIVDESASAVKIIRFLYGKSNWIAVLKGL